MREKEMVGGCCVCSDDQGSEDNPLVYCDGVGCNIAVHQACYGIVNVPEGSWFCSKCKSQERTVRLRCELCPSKEGALKKTDNGNWAHVVCALYIPEVAFQNVQTMEPIVLKSVPQERYGKVCCLCQDTSKATLGACMSCNRNGCKQTFHVTCGQMRGLLCEEAGSSHNNVTYCGYCPAHAKLMKRDPSMKPGHRSKLKCESLKNDTVDGSEGAAGNNSGNESSSTTDSRHSTKYNRSSSVDVNGKAEESSNGKRGGKRQRTASGRSSASPVAATGEHVNGTVRVTEPSGSAQSESMRGRNNAGTSGDVPVSEANGKDDSVRGVGVNGKDKSGENLLNTAVVKTEANGHLESERNLLTRGVGEGAGSSPSANYNDLSSLVMPTRGGGKNNKRSNAGDSGGKKAKRVKKGRRVYNRQASTKSAESRKAREEPVDLPEEEDDDDSGEEPLSGSYTSKSGLLRGLQNGLTAAHMLGNEINTGNDSSTRLEDPKSVDQDDEEVDLNISSIPPPSDSSSSSKDPKSKTAPGAASPSEKSATGKTTGTAEPRRSSSSNSSATSGVFSGNEERDERGATGTSGGRGDNESPPLGDSIFVDFALAPTVPDGIQIPEEVAAFPVSLRDLMSASTNDSNTFVRTMHENEREMDVVRLYNSLFELHRQQDTTQRDLERLRSRREQLMTLNGNLDRLAAAGTGPAELFAPFLAPLRNGSSDALSSMPPPLPPSSLPVGPGSGPGPSPMDLPSSGSMTPRGGGMQHSSSNRSPPFAANPSSNSAPGISRLPKDMHPPSAYNESPSPAGAQGSFSGSSRKPAVSAPYQPSPMHTSPHRATLPSLQPPSHSFTMPSPSGSSSSSSMADNIHLSSVADGRGPKPSPREYVPPRGSGSGPLPSVSTSSSAMSGPLPSLTVPMSTSGYQPHLNDHRPGSSTGGSLPPMSLPGGSGPPSGSGMQPKRPSIVSGTGAGQSGVPFRGPGTAYDFSPRQRETGPTTPSQPPPAHLGGGHPSPVSPVHDGKGPPLIQPYRGDPPTVNSGLHRNQPPMSRSSHMPPHSAPSTSSSGGHHQPPPGTYYQYSPHGPNGQLPPPPSHLPPPSSQPQSTHQSPSFSYASPHHPPSSSAGPPPSQHSHPPPPSSHQGGPGPGPSASPMHGGPVPVSTPYSQSYHPGTRPGAAPYPKDKR